jgi:hypothetical protein
MDNKSKVQGRTMRPYHPDYLVWLENDGVILKRLINFARRADDPKDWATLDETWAQRYLTLKYLCQSGGPLAGPVNGRLTFRLWSKLWEVANCGKYELGWLSEACEDRAEITGVPLAGKNAKRQRGKQMSRAELEAAVEEFIAATPAGELPDADEIHKLILGKNSDREANRQWVRDIVKAKTGRGPGKRGKSRSKTAA